MLAGRLVREEKRWKEEERRRRHESWTFFSALFYANRGESEPPMTKEEYQEKCKVEEGKKKPTTPTEKEWREQALAREAWKELRETYYRAAQSLYYFEETMGYANHLFERPPEPSEPEPVAAESATERREAAERSFVEGLRAQVAGQKERAHRPSPR